MDVATFRTQFAAFADEADYPDETIDLWLGVAAAFVDPARWGTLADLGMALYAAHNISLDKRERETAAVGGAPGQNSGPLAQKSVDKAAATYDTAAASHEGGDNYNLTTYGTRYLHLAKLAGIGGIVAGAGYLGYAPALSQPWVWL